MTRYGIVVDIDNVLITSGSQQALDLIGKVLINPGDRILTETPSYLGALQAFTMYGRTTCRCRVTTTGCGRAWRTPCAPGRGSCTCCRTSRTRRA